MQDGRGAPLLFCTRSGGVQKANPFLWATSISVKEVIGTLGVPKELRSGVLEYLSFVTKKGPSRCRFVKSLVDDTFKPGFPVGKSGFCSYWYCIGYYHDVCHARKLKKGNPRGRDRSISFVRCEITAP